MDILANTVGSVSFVGLEITKKNHCVGDIYLSIVKPKYISITVVFPCYFEYWFCFYFVSRLPKTGKNTMEEMHFNDDTVPNIPPSL